jgi:hypothetical protein
VSTAPDKRETPASVRRRRLVNRLKALAFEALSLLGGPLRGPVEARAADEFHRVHLALVPVDAGMGGEVSTQLVGNFFSPLETAIHATLGDACLLGKQIAGKTGQTYDARFQTILRNLVARKVLQHSPKEGYRRCTQKT